MKHYCNLKVEEETRKRIKELAAKSGKPMKDFLKETFNLVEERPNEKKKIFDFKF